MAKANLAALHDLHGAIAKYYIDAAQGEEELSSGTLAAINSFLKNNDITVDILTESPAQSLTAELQLLIMDKEEVG